MRPRLVLPALVVCSLWSSLGGVSGCVRNTPGFCNMSADCNDSNALCVLPAHQCVQSFARGALAGTQQAPPTASDAAGTFKLVLSDDQSHFTYELVHNAVGATAAHIHRGKPGDNGPVVFTLKAQADVIDTLAIAADQLADLRAGNYYADLHTPAFPAGELRSTLWPTDPALDPTVVTLNGVLSGLEELPPTTSTATGTTTVTVDPNTGNIHFQYQDNLQGNVQGVHIHQGQFGFEGPHIVDMPTTSAQQNSGDLTPGQILNGLRNDYLYLMRGGLSYLNIHTDAFSGGELRGQLLRDKSLPWNTLLEGAQVAPTPSMSGVTGNVAFFLSQDRTHLAWLLTHDGQEMNVPIDTVGIFKGDVGMTGATALCVLMQMDGAQGPDHTQGYCDVGGANNIQLADLTGGKLYVQASNGATGVVRGQLLVPPLPQ